MAAVAHVADHARAVVVAEAGRHEHPLKVLRAVKQIVKSDKVLVGVSGGKDSAVTLDLVSRFFPEIEGYFYYLVPGLEFQEEYLDRTERKYGIKIHRRAHWCLSMILRESGYRPPTRKTDDVPNLTVTEVENVMRRQYGAEWIITGERAAESLHRRGMLKACGGYDVKRRRAYPIAFWPVADVRRYIATNHIALSPESTILGRSFGNFRADVLMAIQKHFPDDFAKITRMFPHVEAAIYREKFYGKPKAEKPKRSPRRQQP